MFHVAGLIVVLAVITIIAGYMRKETKNSKYHLALWIMFSIYIAGYLYFVFLSRKPGSECRVDLTPFQTYFHLFDQSESGERFATNFQIIGLESSVPLVGILLNMILYYPLGYFLLNLFPKLKAKQVLLIACLCAVATETIQYIVQIGWCETDDVLHNLIGAALGVVIFRLQRRFDNRC